VKISYNGLWKLLIDNGMQKKDLIDKIGVSSTTIAKMGKGEKVSLDVLERICLSYGMTKEEQICARSRSFLLSADNAHAEGAWIGICGELGADLELTEEFLKMGLDELSVSPAMVLPLRKRIRECE